MAASSDGSRIATPVDDSPGLAYGVKVPSAGVFISGASRRLRALAALSGSLTDALAPREAADLVEQQALSALGASSAVVVTLGEFPPKALPTTAAEDHPSDNTLHVVHAIGVAADVRAALDKLPLDAAVPFAEVAREGAPLFLSNDAALLRYKDWGKSMIAAGSHSAAIVPVWANGELRGVLGLTWPDSRTFDEDECAFVLTLGVMCAQAIMRSYLRAAEKIARDGERSAREEAEAANRSKAHFVATLSHELRTPLNAVMGYSALLNDGISGPVSPMQKEHLGHMRASGDHLLGLIEQLLGYARIEAGEEVVRVGPVDLAAILNESIALVQPLVPTKGLSIRTEGPLDVAELHTDASKLRQILINVLANALKFSSSGEIVLEVHLDGLDTPIRVIIEITDPGQGIPAEDFEHVFDPFWQKDPHSAQKGGSSGLGLAVARQLARLLGGDIHVSRSEVGVGTTFVISLPLRYNATSLPNARTAPERRHVNRRER
ncbi:MAG: GAF domain-containing sensor histidine kinase [Gemmatimonadaceae bacterium]